MLDTLIQIDHQLFQLINQACSNTAFDILMPVLRNKYVWFPFYAALAAWLIYRYKWPSILLMVFAIGTVVITDQTSAAFLKPLINRLRPCQLTELERNINILVNCGSGLSFPSSHAANHFGIAVFFSLFFNKKRATAILLSWAAAICFAQVYVGVHFPLDILGGMILGILAGGCLYLIYSKLTIYFGYGIRVYQS